MHFNANYELKLGVQSLVSDVNGMLLQADHHNGQEELVETYTQFVNLCLGT